MEYGEPIGIIYINRENRIKIMVNSKALHERLDKSQRYCLIVDLEELIRNIKFLNEMED